MSNADCIGTPTFNPNKFDFKDLKEVNNITSVLRRQLTTAQADNSDLRRRLEAAERERNAAENEISELGRISTNIEIRAEAAELANAKLREQMAALSQASTDGVKGGEHEQGD